MYKIILFSLIFIIGCSKKTQAIGIKCLEEKEIVLHSYELIDDKKQIHTINFYSKRCLKYQCINYIIKNKEFKETSSKVQNNNCFSGDLFF